MARARRSGRIQSRCSSPLLADCRFRNGNHRGAGAQGRGGLDLRGRATHCCHRRRRDVPRSSSVRCTSNPHGRHQRPDDHCRGRRDGAAAVVRGRQRGLPVRPGAMAGSAHARACPPGDSRVGRTLTSRGYRQARRGRIPGPGRDHSRGRRDHRATWRQDSARWAHPGGTWRCQRGADHWRIASGRQGARRRGPCGHDQRPGIARSGSDPSRSRHPPRSHHPSRRGGAGAAGASPIIHRSICPDLHSGGHYACCRDCRRSAFGCQWRRRDLVLSLAGAARHRVPMPILVVPTSTTWRSASVAATR